MKNYCFDIETVPLPTDQLQAVLPVFDVESVKTGNLGAEKAAEKIEKAQREQLQNFYKKAALSALTGQVAMIGMRDADDSLIIEGSEPDVINEWFEWFRSNDPIHWIGFNIASFDVPFLIRRAWVNHIAVPGGLVRGRYLGDNLTDLMELWTLSERGQGHFPVSLDQLAQYFGIGQKTGSGAQFHELLRYDPAKALEYLINDLELTWKIAELMGAIRKVPPKTAPAVTVSRNGAEIIFY